ncbi:ribbon-helix-helix domain-containing protein [Candidatus Poriferisocius sp.]|uniref:ribbon-helix-helix domain-containing protein n=1 Tax=Candidatus Poriferisocius sp. TaxID=3101276 RepID=UPI003B595217
MSPKEQRIMRIPIPIPLIREMDAVIMEGLGGYTTRAEFIVDAIQERILELSFDVVEDAGAPQGLLPTADDMARGLHEAAPAPGEMVKLSETALEAPSSGATVDCKSDLSCPEGLPLFGLHNRDYPSLWALAQLASLTEKDPMPAEAFYDEALREAWRFGTLLVAVEKHLGIKCTALFPTNMDKRKSAETRFRSFAIGDFRFTDDIWRTSGPLFEWRLAGLVEGGESGPLIGVTQLGWDVLQSVTGLPVEHPHPKPVAAKFLAHLADHAPSDEKGFRQVVASIGPEGASRQDVLDHFTESWPQWTSNEVSTNSAGYIARAREWGLVEPKQFKGQYNLTPFGHEYATGGMS